MLHYPQLSSDDLLLRRSFEEWIDMYVAIGKDYSEHIMKKAPKKTDPWGNFMSPEVNVVKPPKKTEKVEWRRV
jgi:hypothetical protein